jgi:hypothetical protein
MNLPHACSDILAQLTSVVNQISPEDYSKPSATLGGSSIGQHLRHTLEFFFCFKSGCETGVINYDKRAHDKLIETDKFLALHAIAGVSDFLKNLKENTTLMLEARYDSQVDFTNIITNVSRELVYNIEHAVHHMAIMKIGIREVAPYIDLPANFGIAASTVQHQRAVHKQPLG